VLQCVAVCCGVLRCVAVCCSVLRCVLHHQPMMMPAPLCNTLQRTATKWRSKLRVLQHQQYDDASTALQYTAQWRWSVLQCVAVCGSVLQCVAVCSGVLQCVAICWGVLQCVAACCIVGNVMIPQTISTSKKSCCPLVNELHCKV